MLSIGGQPTRSDAIAARCNGCGGGRRRCGGDLLQRRAQHAHEAIHLVHRVVVHERDAHDAVGVPEAEVVDEPLGVEMAPADA